MSNAQAREYRLKGENWHSRADIGRKEESKIPPHIVQDMNTSHLYVILVATACSEPRKSGDSPPLPLRNTLHSLCPYWENAGCLVETEIKPVKEREANERTK